MEARANVDSTYVADASELETRRPQKGRAALPPVPRLRNRFAALDDVEGDDSHETGCPDVHAPPRGPSQRSSSGNKKHKKKVKKGVEKKAAGGEEGGKGNEIDAVGQELPEMDDFAWCHVFGQVGNAAELARLRLVCQRWRAVIDAEERLWRALVERDFGWKQSESRTGKGARRRQARHIDYQSLYRNLSISTKGVARKERLVAELEQRQQAKLSSFMCQLLPHVLELQIRKATNAKPPNTHTLSYLQSQAPSWLACTHPHAAKGRRSYSLVCKDCQLGMTPKTYQPDQYWEKNWPKVLDYRLDRRKARESMAHRFEGLYTYNPALDNG